MAADTSVATDSATRRAGAGGADAGAAASLAGLDALDLPVAARPPLAQRLWSASWPKVAAVALALGIWQLVVLSGWKPDYVLPPPGPVFAELYRRLGTAEFWEAIGVTATRALLGYAVAVVIGVVVGVAVVRVRVLRVAIGSLITGLQTMPSVAWFPLAILLFGLSERAILFVVVLGAAPSIANGLINGVDYVPTLLKRVGTNLGARGMSLYRHVVLPAALPSFVAGLKQGWAFAWRSLMAGEIIAVVAERSSVGVILNLGREFADADTVLAIMIVILAVGIVVDLVFTQADAAIRRRWGITDTI